MFTVSTTRYVCKNDMNMSNDGIDPALLSNVMSIANQATRPDHLSLDALIEEAYEYAANYSCDAASAVRDVIDAYHEGAAESADALRNGDWDYGRE